MSFPIRPLDEISKSVRGVVRQYLPGTDASLRQNVLYVVAKVISLLTREYELRLQWIFHQIFLTTATHEPIIRLHAAEYGIFAKPEAASGGLVTGVAQPHQTYPAGIRFVSGAETFVTVEGFTANAVGQFSARCAAEQTGARTNRDEGALLNLADAVQWPTIATEAAVGAGGIGGGADAETVEELRQRALRRKASPPQGGALADYENWVLEVPGVVAVWSAKLATGLGSIGVWPLFAGRSNGIPSDADLAAVTAHIEAKRLVRAGLLAAPAVAKPVDLTVALMPDTAAQRAAVTGALQRFFDARERDAKVRPGLPGSPFVLPRAWISETISLVQGETSHRLDVPFTDVVFQPGELPVLGAVEWVAA